MMEGLDSERETSIPHRPLAAKDAIFGDKLETKMFWHFYTTAQKFTSHIIN